MMNGPWLGRCSRPTTLRRCIRRSQPALRRPAAWLLNRLGSPGSRRALLSFSDAGSSWSCAGWYDHGCTDRAPSSEPGVGKDALRLSLGDAADIVHVVEDRRQHEHERVEAVQQPAMPAENMAEILHPKVALHRAQ